LAEIAISRLWYRDSDINNFGPDERMVRMKHLVNSEVSAAVAPLLLVARNDHAVVFAAPGTKSTKTRFGNWMIRMGSTSKLSMQDVSGYKGPWHEFRWLEVHRSYATPRRTILPTLFPPTIAEPNTLKCNELEPAAITVVDNVAVVHCHLTEHWADKSGESEPRRNIKVSYTWPPIKGNGQIIGGMAAVVNPELAWD
jgi:hypothetical protein